MTGIPRNISFSSTSFTTRLYTAQHVNRYHHHGLSTSFNVSKVCFDTLIGVILCTVDGSKSRCERAAGAWLSLWTSGWFKYVTYTVDVRWKCRQLILFSSAGLCDSNVSVRLSVRPSICPTRAGIVSKRRKLASWFLHHLVALILVFWCQISSRHSKGFPRAEASKKGEVGKFSDFLALSVNISKTVADTAKVTIRD